MTPYDLAERWHATAITFRDHEQPATAVAYERCASELESALASVEDELLSLKGAATASGYSADHLGRQVREGKIPNAGRPGAPRIARRDLPRKSNTVALDGAESDLSRTQIVRSAINEGAA